MSIMEMFIDLGTFVYVFVSLQGRQNMRPRLQKNHAQARCKCSYCWGRSDRLQTRHAGRGLQKPKIRFLHESIYVPLSKAMSEHKAISVETTASYTV